MIQTGVTFQNSNSVYNSHMKSAEVIEMSPHVFNIFLFSNGRYLYWFWIYSDM